MRIAVVHSFYDPKEPSGENAVVLAQLRALRDRGHEVGLIARHTGELKKSPGYPARAALAAAGVHGPDPSRELSDFAPDVVHVHNLFPNWGSSWLREWGHRTVVTLHNHRTVCSNALLWRDGGDCHECLDHSTLAALEHRCYRKSRLATLPLAIASRDKGSHSRILHDVAQVLVLNSGAGVLYAELASAPVKVLPNFVEPSQSLGLARSTDRIVFVGRLTHEKGILQLIEQLPEEYGLDVLGDGPLRPDVESLADGVRIVFHGQQPPGEVLHAMQSSAALVIPSLWSEGVPTTALEALSSGTPVVVSKHVASAEDLTEGGAGEIYDPAEPSHLRNALEKVAAARDGYSSAGLSLHRRRFSRAAWLQEIESVYSAVAEQAESNG
ncbi:glycosyltransferase family 4 protein [Luteococcus sp.]|uniref:glycosyltransferase family 4 protein n=1 Tax=Luteococcus sp. TaxID=1969402 RepID=UPI00373632E1